MMSARNDNNEKKANSETTIILDAYSALCHSIAMISPKNDKHPRCTPTTLKKSFGRMALMAFEPDYLMRSNSVEYDNNVMENRFVGHQRISVFMGAAFDANRRHWRHIC